MKMSLQNKESEFVLLNAKVNSKLIKKVDNQLSIHGLSFTEFMVMHHLYGAPGNTMRRIELAESIGISASGVTRLLAPMAKLGFVQKELNSRDARVSLVKLSKAGQKLYKDASIGFAHCAESLVAPLSENQLEKLSELSGKLL